MCVRVCVCVRVRVCVRACVCVHMYVCYVHVYICIYNSDNLLKAFVALNTLCHIKAWPQDALEMVANKFLEDVDLEGEAHKQCVTMCQYFHQSVRTISEKYEKCTLIF